MCPPPEQPKEMVILPKMIDAGLFELIIVITVPTIHVTVIRIR